MAFAVIIASAPLASCTVKTGSASRVSVDKDIIVAINATEDCGDSLRTVPPALLEERVRVSELVRYPGEEGITVPFRFSDTKRYSEITESNLERRIAILIDGQTVSTPVVKTTIDNGACSVVLTEQQATTLFGPILP